MANRLVATGDPDKCLEKLYEFEKIGVIPIIFPIGADDVKMAINVASEYIT